MRCFLMCNNGPLCMVMGLSNRVTLTCPSEVPSQKTHVQSVSIPRGFYPYFASCFIITEKLPKVKGVNMYFDHFCEGGTFFLITFFLGRAFTPWKIASLNHEMVFPSTNTCLLPIKSMILWPLPQAQSPHRCANISGLERGSFDRASPKRGR